MTLRFNNGGFTIVEKLFKALREILQHWRLSLASLLFYILLSLLTNVCRENLLVLASTSNTCSPVTVSSYHTETEQNCPEASQCHTLGNLSHAESICNLSVRCRTQISLEFNLGICSWRNSSNLGQIRNTSSDCLSMTENTSCVDCLQGFINRSKEVEANFEDYSSILRRYDCDRNYSMWGCDQCKEVYKNWLCGITFDFYDDEGTLIKPCLEFCYQTSRKCPFLLPAIQYCGTQAYFCPQHRDLLENSSYAGEPPCYRCTNTNGTQCTPELTNSTDPLSGSAGSTTASVTSLLIGQLVLLLITVTLFDLPVGLA